MFDRKRERNRQKVSEKVRLFLSFRENLKQFVSLDRPGFKLVERMLPVSVSKGLLIRGRVD